MNPRVAPSALVGFPCESLDVMRVVLVPATPTEFVWMFCPLATATTVSVHVLPSKGTSVVSV